eukprot:TRINITY_DN4373_c0_g2_i1.p1 TRINITY_DN4373_c0_g2~~TRINITY_DN4373_c0_g2_i1.p1  ORF type:complete len:248 (+),score=38.45 TRINITY_DN4373_c0_g2_i1:361-1104(+)
MQSLWNRDTGTPRSGKRQSHCGGNTVSVNSLGVSRERGPLMCQGRTGKIDERMGTKEMIVAPTAGKKKMVERERREAVTPSRRQGGGMLGATESGEIYKVMARDARNHTNYKPEKRVLQTEYNMPTRGGDPVSSRLDGLRQFVVSPEAQRKHFQDSTRVGMLASSPAASASYNHQTRLARSVGPRHRPQNASSPFVPSAGSFTPRGTCTGSKRIFAPRDTAGPVISGTHAAPKNAKLASKIGSTAWG